MSNNASFNIGEVGVYMPQNVQENYWLNEKLENDLYGIYYSVQFEGDADTYLIQAKKAPIVGQAEYGMIEMSKSGKSKRFKRVKREDGSNSKSPTLDYEPSTNTRWAIGMAYRAFVQVTGSVEDSRGDFPFDAVQLHAKELLRMFGELKDGPNGEVTESRFGKAVTANDDEMHDDN